MPPVSVTAAAAVAKTVSTTAKGSPSPAPRPAPAAPPPRATAPRARCLARPPTTPHTRAHVTCPPRDRWDRAGRSSTGARSVARPAARPERGQRRDGAEPRHLRVARVHHRAEVATAEARSPSEQLVDRQAEHIGGRGKVTSRREPPSHLEENSPDPLVPVRVDPKVVVLGQHSGVSRRQQELELVAYRNPPGPNAPIPGHESRATGPTLSLEHGGMFTTNAPSARNWPRICFLPRATRVSSGDHVRDTRRMESLCLGTLRLAHVVGLL
jgi:hypothetical protein